MFNKFWSTNGSPADVLTKLEKSEPLEGAVQVSKLVELRPTSWETCIVIGRLKFEKYFNHKVITCFNLSYMIHSTNSADNKLIFFLFSSENRL